MRASEAHFPNDLCTCFSAQFSIPLSFLHVCKRRTSKKQNFVLEAFCEDSGGSEVRNYVIDIFIDVRSPSSLPGTEGRRGWVRQTSTTRFGLVQRLSGCSVSGPLYAILNISKSFCLCVNLYQCSLFDKLQMRILKYFLVICNNILPVNITDLLMKNNRL